MDYQNLIYGNEKTVDKHKDPLFAGLFLPKESVNLSTHFRL
jgi:hypothetical protein